MKYPTLSIITVCFNAESTVYACIKSVAQGKSQEVEYLVIDGFSTDGTLDIIREFSEIVDTLISEPDGGIFDAMNKGLSYATGEYVAFLNADDAYLPNAIPVLLDVIRMASDKVDVIYGDWIGVDANGVNHLRRSDHRLRWRYSLCHQAIAARRSIFPAPQGFATDYRLCADFDLILRWQKEAAVFTRIPQPIVRFSESGSSAKYLHRSARESIAIALRRAQSPWSLVFCARVVLFLVKVTIISWTRHFMRFVSRFLLV